MGARNRNEFIVWTVISVVVILLMWRNGSREQSVRDYYERRNTELAQQVYVEHQQVIELTNQIERLKRK